MKASKRETTVTARDVSSKVILVLFDGTLYSDEARFCMVLTSRFARMVADDLIVYGKRVREDYKKALPRRQRRDLMRVPFVLWTNPEHVDLLPPKAN
jgi:hypothetical protein